MNNRHLADFACVERWLKEIGSEESKKQYLRDLRVFTNSVNLNPDQLLAERVEDLRSPEVSVRLRAEDRLRRFFDEADMAKTSKAHIVNAMKSFYKANGLILSLKTPTLARIRVDEYLPTREEIQKMVNFNGNSLRNSAMIMMQAETGMRIGAVTELEWAHLSNEMNLMTMLPKVIPMAVKIPNAITRTGVTFILDDAVNYLRNWLANLGQLKPDTRIFDLDPNTAEDIISNLGVKIGLNPDRKGLKPFHSHCFRKRVQTILEDNTRRKTQTIPLNWVDLLLDHKPRGAQGEAYSLPSTDQLRGAYAIAAPQLRVF